MTKLAMLLLSQGGKDQVFPITAIALKQAWKRLVKRAGIDGLRFHDLRHEAISRLFEKGLNSPEVALISGHRDMRMLSRYTHPQRALIHQKLDMMDAAARASELENPVPS